MVVGVVVVDQMPVSFSPGKSLAWQNLHSVFMRPTEKSAGSSVKGRRAILCVDASCWRAWERRVGVGVARKKTITKKKKARRGEGREKVTARRKQKKDEKQMGKAYAGTVLVRAFLCCCLSVSWRCAMWAAAGPAGSWAASEAWVRQRKKRKKCGGKRQSGGKR